MKTKKMMSIFVFVLIIFFAYISYNISLSDFRLSDGNYSYLGDIKWHRSLDKGFQLAQEKDLFIWDNVPGDDSDEIMMYLREDLDTRWVDNAKIIKTDEDRTIRIFTEEKSAEIMIDENKEKAKLKISDDKIYNLKVEQKNDKYIISQENKPIAVYFWAIWCQYCAGFQANTLGDPRVKKILEEDYVLVAMDLDIDRDTARKYGVSYPPYVLFLDGNDNVLERIPGAVDADYFLPIVTRVRDQVRSK
ncbi:thiol:disulfide interchange protein [Candidatus Methanoperedens nitroreducens]|uniref:Thiol:disulfide interchange protein n=1 Tax=Candidatus Methanoperedens nitratireducens TaxID=1392998 RepID=A0A062VA71_9EURY|nr:thioredoxin family protein [Candidatus Methanoperedens nitroreducens]KCZ72624.1 thiol:disulfide interchange protein [Candidatus Methanoperedens nitroreducens]MDJ1423444.1 thioredoxin family protein [Candidatus Methanoperedens sp.]